jgi:hypothetical protein
MLRIIQPKEHELNLRLRRQEQYSENTKLTKLKTKLHEQVQAERQKELQLSRAS